MPDALLPDSQSAIPLQPVAESELAAALDALGAQAKGLAEADGFKAKAGQVLKLPGADGKLARALVGLGASPKAETFRAAAGRLPAGEYALTAVPQGVDPTEIAVAWG